jgi:hypothetical protein
MMRTLICLAIAILALFLGGCGLGDRAADRTLQIHQIQTTDTYLGRFEIDTSQLPAGAIKTQVESGGDGCPVTILTINQDCPIKVVLVPITKP